MSWIGIVLWIVTNAPELIRLIKSILDLIKTIPKEKQDQVKETLFEAIKTKDKEKVKKALETSCTVGCNSELKKD